MSKGMFALHDVGYININCNNTVTNISANTTGVTQYVVLLAGSANATGSVTIKSRDATTLLGPVNTQANTPFQWGGGIVPLCKGTRSYGLNMTTSTCACNCVVGIVNVKT